MFYGWIIVAVTFVTQFVTVGTVFYSYGVLLKPLADDLGGSRLAVGSALPLTMVVVGIAGPFIGRAVDRGIVSAFMMLGGGAPQFFTNAAIDFVPEPSSAVLIGLGLLALVSRRPGKRAG